MLRFLTISLLLGVVALITPADALVADDFIHTGPAYTQGGGAGPYPEYPNLANTSRGAALPELPRRLS